MISRLRRVIRFLPPQRECHTTAPSKPTSIQLQTLEIVSKHPEFASRATPTSPSLSQSLDSLIEQKSQGLDLKTLQGLDDELSSRINSELSLPDVLHTMNCCALVAQTGATKMTAFQKCFEYLNSYYSRCDSNIFLKTQALYYASFYRDSNSSQRFIMKVTRKISVEDLKPLGLFELSMLCNALFSSSVPIQNGQILSLIENKIYEDLSCLTNSPILISLIKALRISNYQSIELCDTLAQHQQVLLSQHSLLGRIHLCVYLATCLYSNKSFVHSLVTSCLHNVESLRLKDVHNLTWVIATYCDSDINDALSQSTLPLRASRLMERRELCDLPMTVTLILYLWIAGVQLSKEVIEHVSETNIRALKGHNFFKDTSNLNLLLSCVAIEAPDLLRFKLEPYQEHRLAPKFEKHLKMRPDFRRIWLALRHNQKTLGLEDIRFSYQIPGLYVGGVTAKYKNKLINVEVLDSHVCLTNSSHLNGRMLLKLRLLEKRGDQIIKVPPSLPNDSIMGFMKQGLERMQC